MPKKKKQVLALSVRAHVQQNSRQGKGAIRQKCKKKSICLMIDWSHGSWTSLLIMITDFKSGALATRSRCLLKLQPAVGWKQSNKIGEWIWRMEKDA